MHFLQIMQIFHFALLCSIFIDRTEHARKEIKGYIKPIITRDIRGITDDDFDKKFGCYYGRYHQTEPAERYCVTDYSQSKDASDVNIEWLNGRRSSFMIYQKQ